MVAVMLKSSAVHHLPALISSYLAEKDKQTKNVPTTAESSIYLALMSTSSILTMAMFSSLVNFVCFVV
jgi:hypothetical protein